MVWEVYDFLQKIEQSQPQSLVTACLINLVSCKNFQGKTAPHPWKNFFKGLVITLKRLRDAIEKSGENTLNLNATTESYACWRRRLFISTKF